MSLPEHIQEIFSTLEGILGRVYLVGGSVRDLLIDREPHDLDFACTLLPDDIDTLLKNSGLKTYTTGKRFGTIGCRISGIHVEVTTFRTETYDGETRRPEVLFVDDVSADLSRRDFTMNAIAMRVDGSLVDPFGGQNDIDARKIRAVGNAGERFYEDPLRMLRAGRFISQLGFELDDLTFNSAVKHADRILRVSKERWVKELDVLLIGPHAASGLRYLAQSKLLLYMIPELALQIDFDQDSPYHELNLYEHSLRTVMLTASDVELRWAALLHDVGKPFVRQKNAHGYSNYPDHELVGAEIALKIGRYLSWSNKRVQQVSELVRDHLHDDSPITQADAAARYA